MHLQPILVSASNLFKCSSEFQWHLLQGMSSVAFRPAPSVGRLSCFAFVLYRPSITTTRLWSSSWFTSCHNLHNLVTDTRHITLSCFTRLQGVPKIRTYLKHCSFPIFRQYALRNACRAIGTGFVMFVHLFDTKSAPWVSRKPFDLESPNFTRTSVPTLSTASPDMTSLSFSGQKFKRKYCLRRLCVEFLENGLR